MPSVLLFIFAYAFPFFSGVKIAFTDWDGISQTYESVGLQNFINAFSDVNLGKAVRFTVLFAVLATAANNVLALCLALLLNKKLKGTTVSKTIIFIPMALSAVLASFVWTFIDSKIYAKAFVTHSLLASPKTVLLGVILIGLWNGIGSNVMIYLAGLTNIPKECYESASIDGANGWDKIRYIILPLLGPTYTVCITLTLTTCLREFSTVMAATGGGPANSSMTIAIFIYRNLFQYNKAGYGQAVAVMFMIALIVIGTSLKSFFRNREVEM